MWAVGFLHAYVYGLSLVTNVYFQNNCKAVAFLSVLRQPLLYMLESFWLRELAKKNLFFTYP